MAKVKIQNYAFNKSAKTVTFTDYASVRLDSILTVLNTTSNAFIYNPVVSGLGGSVTSNVLTFDFDSSAMSNTDELLIYYDDAALALTDTQLRASAIPVSATSLPLPAGAATDTKQDTGNASLSTIAGKDFATQTTLSAVLAKIIAAPSTEAKQDTIITDLGSVTETAPASDTASSGLNGRLQRVAQRLTSLIALLPTTLGQGTMATSLRVVLPSDQSSIPVEATLTAETTKVIGTVNNSSCGHSATVTITRPSNATAYAAGDVIGDTNGSAILTFASMARAAGEVEITSIEYEIDESARPSGMDMFDVRLYNASPTAIADNAVFDIPSGDRGKYLGKVRIGVPVDEGSTLFIDNDGIGKQITMTGTSLYVILQTVGAYTPTSAGVSRLTIHTRDL